jgi:hypothetical protein
MEIPKFGEICTRRHCDKNSTLNSNRETCDCTYNTTTTKELYNIRGSSHCEMENTTEVRMENSKLRLAIWSEPTMRLKEKKILAQPDVNVRINNSLDNKVR